MSIVTLAEARQQLNYADDDVSDDTEIQAYVDAITTVVEQYKCKIIEQRTVTQDLSLCGEPEFQLVFVPVISMTSLVSYDGLVTWNVANLKVRPSGQVKTLPINSRGPIGDFIATYVAGYAVIPGHYKRGALVMLQQVWETQRGVGPGADGVVGSEETYDPDTLFWTVRKARVWLGNPGSDFA